MIFTTSFRVHALAVCFVAGATAYASDVPVPATAASTAINQAASEEASEPEDKQVKCIDPTTCCAESKKVLGILQKLVAAYGRGDISTYEHYLDEKCTMFDESSKKMIVGKEAVLQDLKSSFAEHAPGGPKPLISLTIDQPYAKVDKMGERCVVTFVATLETGGAKPMKERANVTDVFVKRNGHWKKSYWRGKWEQVTD